jgi:uncharacterized protein (DUF924 family)
MASSLRRSVYRACLSISNYQFSPSSKIKIVLRLQPPSYRHTYYTKARSAPTMNPDAQNIISFWFNRPPMEWIIAPGGLDAQIKSKFGDLVLRARRNELENWTTDPEASVALVALLEQFPRNIFRGSAEAFTSDAKAYDVATKAIAQGFDKQVTVIQASALYMPLMQQESIISLIAARCLFEALKPRCGNEEEHKWVGMGIAASVSNVLVWTTCDICTDFVRQYSE